MIKYEGECPVYVWMMGHNIGISLSISTVKKTFVLSYSYSVHLRWFESKIKVVWVCTHSSLSSVRDSNNLSEFRLKQPFNLGTSSFSFWIHYQRQLWDSREGSGLEHRKPTFSSQQCNLPPGWFEPTCFTHGSHSFQSVKWGSCEDQITKWIQM